MAGGARDVGPAGTIVTTAVRGVKSANRKAKGTNAKQNIEPGTRNSERRREEARTLSPSTFEDPCSLFDILFRLVPIGPFSLTVPRLLTPIPAAFMRED